MRIGEALERLLSPQESGEDGESGGVDAGGAFRAEMEAAVARERARREPRIEDHAAIVLDPRLVLSLQRPQEMAMPSEPIETRDARDARNAARDSAAIDAAQRSMRSHQAERTEAESRGDTEAAESGGEPSGAGAATDSRAETAPGTDDASTESADSANASTATPAQQAGDGAEGGLERAALSALRSAQSAALSRDGGTSVTPESGPAGAIVQKIAVLASADPAVTLGARPARFGVALDEPPAQTASTPVAVAPDAPSAGAQDFGAQTDDQRDSAGDRAVASGGIAAAQPASRAPAGTPVSASFATMFLGAARTADASARSHTAATLAHKSPASSHVAVPVDKDAVLSLLSERLAGALRAGQREVIVRLSPPDLGTLRVRFSIDEQRVSARVEVSDPAVHRALETGVADLRGALLKQDVELRSLTFAAAEHGGQESGGSRSDTNDRDENQTPEGRSAGATNTPAIRRGGRHRSTGLDITA